MMIPVLARAVAPRARDFLGDHKLARNDLMKEAFRQATACVQRRGAETFRNAPVKKLKDGRTSLIFHAPGQG
jgi:hypothetical protein